jgi:hypothetical protein
MPQWVVQSKSFQRLVLFQQVWRYINFHAPVILKEPLTQFVGLQVVHQDHHRCEAVVQGAIATSISLEGCKILCWQEAESCCALGRRSCKAPSASYPGFEAGRGQAKSERQCGSCGMEAIQALLGLGAYCTIPAFPFFFRFC